MYRPSGKICHLETNGLPLNTQKINGQILPVEKFTGMYLVSGQIDHLQECCVYADSGKWQTLPLTNATLSAF